MIHTTTANESEDTMTTAKRAVFKNTMQSTAFYTYVKKAYPNNNGSLSMGTYQAAFAAGLVTRQSNWSGKAICFLTDAGREYAIAQGWIAAPEAKSVAQQFRDMMNGDNDDAAPTSEPAQAANVEAVGDDESQIETLDILIKAQHEIMDKLEYASLEYQAAGYTLVQLQLRLERIRKDATIEKLEAENAKLRAALEASKKLVDSATFKSEQGEVRGILAEAHKIMREALAAKKETPTTN